MMCVGESMAVMYVRECVCQMIVCVGEIVQMCFLCCEIECLCVSTNFSFFLCR